MSEASLDLYGLIGSPVKHSISPQVHSRFAEQTKQAMRYQLVECPPDGFDTTLRQFIAQGGKGLNVTLPFKKIACQTALSLSQRARIAAAANTLFINQGQVVYADNTDGIGLVKDLTLNCHINIKGSHLLVVGAGGAARGVIPALFNAGISRLTLANRNLERATKLVSTFESLGAISSCSLGGLAKQRFDGIINATSASLYNEVPPLPPSLEVKWGYDLVYQATPTAFVRWLKSQGIEQAFDGLGMLVAQAAQSFFLWRGVLPETAPVVAELRHSI